MPSLPTVEFDQEKYDLIWSKFPGETEQEKRAAYEEWLTWQVQFYVTSCVRRDSLHLGEEQMIEAVQAASDVLIPPPPPAEESDDEESQP